MSGLLHRAGTRAPKPERGQDSRRSCDIVGITIAVLVFALFAATAPIAAQADMSSAHSDAIVQIADDLPGNVKGTPRDPDIWRSLRKGGRGHTAVPDRKAGTLIQSSGQRWRQFRETLLPRYGIWGLAGMCALLALFFMVRGRIRIEAGFSGNLVLRFGSIERVAHWLLAVSFIVLAITGLNILYGSQVVKPLLGYGAFAQVTAYGKWLHDFTGYAFMAGLVLVLVLWARDNMPNRHDLIWLLRGGGLFSRGTHPPAKRFNAGQKIIFWFVVLAGAPMSFSGICLIFPFTFTPFSDTFAVVNLFGYDLPTDLSLVQEMQLTHAWHAVLGIIMIVVIIAHIYLGSIGMEGAYDAMANGYVDENWAREHHPLWAAELGLEADPDRVTLSEEQGA